MRVTGILKSAGLIDTSHFTDFHRDRGTAVHMATAFYDEGGLDESTLHPSVRPRFEAWRRFREEVDPRLLAIEEGVQHRILRYKGTLDRRVIINGDEGVLDIKPPTRCAWHGVQLAAYADCFERPLKRWSVHLKDDESYVLVEHKDRLDYQIFRAALVIAAWKGDRG